MKNCGIIVFLVLGMATSNYTSSRTREKKVLGVFTVVKFPNDACTSGTSNRNGTCYTASECTSKGGSSSGSCASSFGVCCIFEKSCGSTASENCTYFTSTGVSTSSTTSTSCSLSVCKSDSTVCQLRLDFDGFTTAGPLTVTTQTTKVPVNAIANDKEANSVGNCQIDQFTVSSPGNKNPPTICGTSTGDHMYVDASDTCTTLQYLRSTSDTTTASFTIKITQVECTSKTKAPDSCTQYHTAASGTVNSYNYQSGSGTGTHLGSQDYSLCIRAERGACAICYSAADTEFQMGNTNAFPIDTGCGTTAVIGALDYILIPGGVCAPTGDSVWSNDKYCGTALLCPGAAGAVSANAVKNTVCTMKKPFKISVVTNDYEDASAAISEGQGVPRNQGFQLDYWQTTLCLNQP